MYWHARNEVFLQIFEEMRKWFRAFSRISKPGGLLVANDPPSSRLVFFLEFGDDVVMLMMMMTMMMMMMVRVMVMVMLR